MSIGGAAGGVAHSAGHTDGGRKMRKVSDFRPCNSRAAEASSRGSVVWSEPHEHATCYAISLGQGIQQRRQASLPGKSRGKQSPALDELHDAETEALQDLRDLEKCGFAVTWPSGARAALDVKAEESTFLHGRGSRDEWSGLYAEIAVAFQPDDDSAHSSKGAVCQVQKQALRDLSELQRSGLAVRWQPAFS